MHLPIMPYHLAPIATGHPLSPPPDRCPPMIAPRAPDESGASGLGDRRGQPPSLPTDPEALLDNPEDIVAPPSLMQLRIISLLDAGAGLRPRGDTPEDTAQRPAG